MVTKEGSIMEPHIPVDHYGVGEFKEEEFEEINSLLRKKYWRHNITPSPKAVRTLVDKIENKRNAIQS